MARCGRFAMAREERILSIQGDRPDRVFDRVGVHLEPAISQEDHHSMKRAADAMGVTPGAVSQQIRLLGDRIGQPLFTRSREGVVLTGAGAVVHPALLSAFDQITRSMAQMGFVALFGLRPQIPLSWLVPAHADGLGHAE